MHRNGQKWGRHGTAACHGENSAATPPVRFDMPPVASSGDIVKAIGSLLSAVAAGQLTADESATLATVLGVKLRAIETVELERRLAELEAQLSRRNY